jgi:molybdopterin molybdotransferase
VLDTVRAHRFEPGIENVTLDDACGRVLARDIAADRPYPPFARSIRDGFAVRASDMPGPVRLVGEVRAGSQHLEPLRAGEAVEIMTGAPVPAGSDAVIMVEHAHRNGSTVSIDRPVQPGDFIVPRGAEVAEGSTVIAKGTRIDYGHIAAAASVGCAELPVYARVRVAIVATGDELVPAASTPEPYQIRNSNSHTVAAQVARAGATPEILPVARDNYESTRALVERGLEAGMLLLSGGVSAGKYDIVEQVLADLGAEFFFDRVLIQPGQPVVFGRVRDRFFFGLPGNPVSTTVTFEIFARAAIELMSGRDSAPLPFVYARLSSELRHRPGLTRFLPARLEEGGRTVQPIRWQGSGDVFALAAANALVVAREDRESWPPGEFIEVLLR